MGKEYLPAGKRKERKQNSFRGMGLAGSFGGIGKGAEPVFR